MTAKRYLVHDVQLEARSGRFCVFCSRCDAHAEAVGQYAALALIDDLPCAEVELDDEGFPKPKT